jgi:hypothetical protein
MPLNYRWTSEEKNTLRLLYGSASKEEILAALPLRSWEAIQHRTRSEKLTRKPEGTKKADLSVLLTESPEQAYYLGLLFADGSFHHQNNSIALSLAERDLTTLTNYSRFISHKNGPSELTQKGQFGVKSSDKTVFPVLVKRYDLHSRKTYNPPSHLPYTDPELLRCFLIGFIDGDGNILDSNKSKQRTLAWRLRIALHVSWLPFMENLSQTLGIGLVSSYFRINPKDDEWPKLAEYTVFQIFKQQDIADLKKTAEEHGLPFMGRKWDQVDSGYERRTPYATKTIIALAREGKTPEEIFPLTGYTRIRSVRNAIKRYKEQGLI